MISNTQITAQQMRKFLKFVHDDVVYCKYYEVVYILFHTGMRISEFCGLTLKDIDLEKRTVNIDHQLQRTADMRYIIETTKTDAGTRVLPITEDVAEMFQAIIEDRNAPKVEKSIDGYSGFLFYADNGMPLVAMHWAAPIQPHGRQIQRYLSGTDAKHHASCVSTHLLQQYGKIGNESQDTAVPHGAFGYISHDECVYAYRI